MEPVKPSDDTSGTTGLEMTTSPKSVTFATTAKVTTIESFTESFHAELIVEEAIREARRRHKDDDDVAEVSKTLSSVKQVDRSTENTLKIVANEEVPTISDRTEEVKLSPHEFCDRIESNVSVESTPLAQDLSDPVVDSSKELGSPQPTDSSADASFITAEISPSSLPDESPPEDITPSFERLEVESRSLGSDLYPQVSVRFSPESELIECKDLGERGGQQQGLRKGSGGSLGSGSGSGSGGRDSRKGSGDHYVLEKDLDTILADVEATLLAVEGTLFDKKADQLRVAVVGAGPAGLCAARHLLAEGIEAEVFEQCSDIGGTWVYTEQTHSGSHVFPLHSSLYHDLWTNLPKETMQYPDFPYREEGHSYLPSEKVLQYLVDYADHFNLHKIIKVKHQVKLIAPLGNYWSVAVEDLARQLEVVSHFDAVMVCSGPNTIPVYPTIDGLAKFSGKQLHSRDYRRAETYGGKRVLVVGLGPSGLDITYQLQPFAKQVFVSHNRSKDVSMTFPDGVILKPKVKSLFDKTVTFEDNTEEDVDVIIYCTGYTYNFPFLTEECGLIVDQNVSPLYKHLINIEHPTMCIVGLPKYCPHQYMVDYQVRGFLNVLLGRTQLPSKEEMLADLEADRSLRLSQGQRKKDFHKLGKERTKAYMDDLATLGQLEPVPPVVYKLFFEAFIRAIKDFRGFRKYNYKIVDSENFSMEPIIEAGGKGEKTIE